jgi:hypothetical protein
MQTSNFATLSKLELPPGLPMPGRCAAAHFANARRCAGDGLLPLVCSAKLTPFFSRHSRSAATPLAGRVVFEVEPVVFVALLGGVVVLAVVVPVLAGAPVVLGALLEGVVVLAVVVVPVTGLEPVVVAGVLALVLEPFEELPQPTNPSVPDANKSAASAAEMHRLIV